jgi:glycerol-3-phosphate acyltransferase PlsY
VATALGILLAISLPVGIAACATWLMVAFAFKYSSLSALVALAVAPVFAYGLADLQRAELALFIAVLVWIRHWANIQRLLSGQEPKIGGRSA